MPNLPPELLSILRCPVTGSMLNQDGDELVSAADGAAGQPLRYSINDGIPVLLPADLLTAATRAGTEQHASDSTTDSTTK